MALSLVVKITGPESRWAYLGQIEPTSPTSQTTKKLISVVDDGQALQV